MSESLYIVSFQVIDVKENLERERESVCVRGCIAFGVSMQKGVCGSFTIPCSHLFCLCAANLFLQIYTMLSQILDVTLFLVYVNLTENSRYRGTGI